MKTKMIHSDEMKRYYRGDLDAILNELKGGEEVYTNHFEYIGRYNFKGKDKRPHLRKCLRTLEADGLLENINEGFNMHLWNLTEKGKQYLHENHRNKRQEGDTSC